MQNCNYHIHRIVNIIEMDDGIDFANKDKMYDMNIIPPDYRDLVYLFGFYKNGIYLYFLSSH